MKKTKDLLLKISNSILSYYLILILFNYLILFFIEIFEYTNNTITIYVNIKKNIIDLICSISFFEKFNHFLFLQVYFQRIFKKEVSTNKMKFITHI